MGDKKMVRRKKKFTKTLELAKQMYIAIHRYKHGSTQINVGRLGCFKNWKLANVTVRTEPDGSVSLVFRRVE